MRCNSSWGIKFSLSVRKTSQAKRQSETASCIKSSHSSFIHPSPAKELPWSRNRRGIWRYAKCWIIDSWMYRNDWVKTKLPCLSYLSAHESFRHPALHRLSTGGCGEVTAFSPPGRTWLWILAQVPEGVETVPLCTDTLPPPPAQLASSRRARARHGQGWGATGKYMAGYHSLARQNRGRFCMCTLWHKQMSFTS